MEETKTQNSTQEKNSKKYKAINIDHFYKEFKPYENKYDPQMLALSKPTRKKKPEKVSFSLFKRIISTYLRFYFEDLYSDFIPSYFPLGGLIQVVRPEKWYRKSKDSKGNSKFITNENSMGLFWFKRPSHRMHYYVSIKKLTGKRNQLPKIERDFLRKMNKDLLPIFTEEVKKRTKSKTLYSCILTSYPLKA